MTKFWILVLVLFSLPVTDAWSQACINNRGPLSVVMYEVSPENVLFYSTDGFFNRYAYAVVVGTEDRVENLLVKRTYDFIGYCGGDEAKQKNPDIVSQRIKNSPTKIRPMASGDENRIELDLARNYEGYPRLQAIVESCRAVRAEAMRTGKRMVVWPWGTITDRPHCTLAEELPTRAPGSGAAPIPSGAVQDPVVKKAD